VCDRTFTIASIIGSGINGNMFNAANQQAIAQQSLLLLEVELMETILVVMPEMVLMIISLLLLEVELMETQYQFV